MLFDPCADCGCQPAGVVCGACFMTQETLTLTHFVPAAPPVVYTLRRTTPGVWDGDCLPSESPLERRYKMRVNCIGAGLGFSVGRLRFDSDDCSDAGSASSILATAAQGSTLTCEPFDLVVRYNGGLIYHVTE